IASLEARLVLPDTEPGHCTDDAFGPLGAVAGRDGIVYARQQAAVGNLLRVSADDKNGARATDMEHARGRGSEAGTNGSLSHRIQGIGGPDSPGEGPERPTSTGFVRRVQGAMGSGRG